MELFILMILFAAWVQSMLKLTLVPRLYRWGILILSVLPVFVFRDRVAASSFQSIGAFLADPVNLRDFCALIVIQELLALLLGFSLLKNRELGRGNRFWKYAALLPSILLPAGAMYVEAVAFNTLIRYDFDVIMWGTALLLVTAGALMCELLPFLTGRGIMEKIAAALNATWILVLLAVFLPAAAEGEFSAQAECGAQWEPLRDLSILGILAGCVFCSGAAIHFYRKYKEKKFHKKEKESGRQCVM